MSDNISLKITASGKLSLNQNLKQALLVLEDGTSFLGKAFGKEKTSIGELVFNTSMTGYQEVLTDPSYAGQIITFTTPEIGNYGVNPDDIESRAIFARGLVVRRLSTIASSFRATQDLDSYLKEHDTPGIYDVDTRAITRKIRDQGAMRAGLTTDPELFAHQSLEELKAEMLKRVLSSPQMQGQDCTQEVTIKEQYTIGSGSYKVAVLDFGIKLNILRQLTERGIEATVFPARTKAQTILAGNFHGIFLSNGPGDPAACQDIIKEIKELCQSGTPVFGICLGHQLVSLALGATTYKLKFGHRGGNQPVLDKTTGRIEVTSQNHGFAVNQDNLPEELELTHINLNDGSVEGFKHKKLPIFSVQYHPESSPGPHDSNYLFDRFIELMQSRKTVGGRK
jgi:carbamoyl-phosphate synthase small subunit